jgi:hypothetical protein
VWHPQKIVPDGRSGSSKKETMRMKMVLEAQHPDVCPQRHFAQAVSVKVKLVLNHVIIVFLHRQVLLQSFTHVSLSEMTVTRCQLVPEIRSRSDISWTIIKSSKNVCVLSPSFQRGSNTYHMHCMSNKLLCWSPSLVKRTAVFSASST